MKPSISVKSLCSALLVLVVAHEDVDSAETNLAASEARNASVDLLSGLLVYLAVVNLVSCQVSHLWDTCKFNFVRRERTTDVVLCGLVRKCSERARSRVFGLAIALAHVSLENAADKLNDVRGNWRRSSQAHAHPVKSHLSSHALEYERVPERVLDSIVGIQVRLLRFKCRKEESLSDTSLLLHACHDLLIDAVVETRNRRKDSRPKSLEILSDLEGITLVEANHCT